MVLDSVILLQILSVLDVLKLVAAIQARLNDSVAIEMGLWILVKMAPSFLHLDFVMNRFELFFRHISIVQHLLFDLVYSLNVLGFIAFSYLII